MQMYFLSIVLPQNLDKKILQHKKWMAEKYGCKVGLKSPAHITIAQPFWMAEEKEQSLITDIENISSKTVSFTITTANFSSFAPRTLFVATEISDTLNAVKKFSDQFFREKNYGMKIESRPFHPHITIATRDLHKKDFWEAWEYFKDKIFREEFTPDGLSLLKHNGITWDVVYAAPFTKV